MAGRKKGQQKSWKKPSSSFGRENYDGDSDDSTDQDWMTDQKKSIKRLKERSRGFARESGEIRRNFNSKRNGDGSRLRKKHGLGEDEDDAEDTELRQCYWVDCLKIARRGSKYCSDECGIKLADIRIKMLLPDRLWEWNSTPCVATINNRKELAKIEEQLNKFKNQYEELEQKRQALDKYIDAVSQICHESDESDDSELGEEVAVGCVSCGHETNTKNYVKHVDRCFIKTEKQVEFGDNLPVYLPGTRLYCNTFVKSNGSYCKRLAVNCPFHSKRTNFAKNAVCGAPLTNGELKLDTICTTLKSKCLRHYNWERVQRAEIDIRKVECWTSQTKMEKQQKECTQQMSNRAGLLNLLINSTKTEGR